MMRLKFFLIFTCLVPILGFAENQKLSSFVVTLTSDSTLSLIANRYEIVSRTGDKYLVYVPQDAGDDFLKIVPTALKVQHDISAELLGVDGKELAGYRTFDEVEADLFELANEFSDIAVLETYGQSRDGRPLYYLRVSDNVVTREFGEPALLINSATHGDELITVEILMSHLETLLRSYGKDPRITEMVNGAEIFFAPVVNPDGFSRRSRYAHGVDPNRQFPYPGNETRESVDCIAQLIDLVAEFQFDGTLDVHAHGQIVMYPWAYKRDLLPLKDRSLFANLAEEMASSAGYRHGQISRILYPAVGSSADYFYWKHNTVAMALEVARSKVPRSGAREQAIKNTEKLFWSFISHFLEPAANQGS